MAAISTPPPIARQIGRASDGGSGRMALSFLELANWEIGLSIQPRAAPTSKVRKTLDITLVAYHARLCARKLHVRVRDHVPGVPEMPAPKRSRCRGSLCHQSDFGCHRV